MESRLRTLFEKREEENDGDFKIICNDGVVVCHSLILRHTSDFFKDLLKYNKTGEYTVDNEVLIIEAAVGCLYISDYLHQDKYVYDNDEKVNVYMMLNEWLVKKEILNRVSNHIEIKNDNWLRLFLEFDQYERFDDMKTKLGTYFEYHIDTESFIEHIIDSDDFGKISKNSLINLFKYLVHKKIVRKI